MYAQLTNAYFSDYVEQNRKVGIPIKDKTEYSRRLFVVIQRTTRGFSNFDDVYDLMVKLGKETNRDVIVFDDKKQPTFNETLDIFNRADLIVGAHGAAFANLLAGTPGATVVEIHCTGTVNIRMPFRLLALRLGMRYFGTQTTRPKATSARCNSEGIMVDLNELEAFLRTVPAYLPNLL